MLDYAPSSPFPWAYASAGIVEGEESVCYPGTQYDEANIISATETAITQGYDVVTELSPYNCNANTSIDAYIAEVNDIITAIKDYPGAQSQWQGIMLDEENWFGYSPNDFEVLNYYTYSLISQVTGIAWWFTQNRPSNYSLATYNALIGSSWQVPQVYASDDPPILNSECSTYNYCSEAITIDQQLNPSGCYNSYVCASEQIWGYLWNLWLRTGWFAYFVAV
ncbi:MAG TPA: hypothetical protein VF288_09375 [Mycobacteriales bacterium]